MMLAIVVGWIALCVGFFLGAVWKGNRVHGYEDYLMAYETSLCDRADFRRGRQG